MAICSTVQYHTSERGQSPLIILQKDGTLELRLPDAHMKQQHSLV